MPDWNPLQVGLVVGVVSGLLWSTRVVIKQHRLAGVWMLFESRFWRSMATGFAITFVLGTLVAAILAGVVWLLNALILRLV